MPRLSRRVVRRGVAPLLPAAEGVGEEDVGGEGEGADLSSPAPDDKLTTLLIRGREGSTCFASLSLSAKQKISLQQFKANQLDSMTTGLSLYTIDRVLPVLLFVQVDVQS